MAFVQIGEEDAKKFTDFLIQSKAWNAVPVRQEWEAFRLSKTRKTSSGDPFHSPLDVVVIHKNKKGIHSFDPLHLVAYEQYMKSGVTDSLTFTSEMPLITVEPSPVDKFVDKELRRITDICNAIHPDATVTNLSVFGEEVTITISYKLKDIPYGDDDGQG